MRVTRVIGAVAIGLALSTAAFAQPPADTGQGGRRPRIGLALGGGSARGLAHIGVLRWFEANHIPIDVIAGTSMGGLVGGAYASGMTPAEIAALMQEADWDLMFLSDSPYKHKVFRRKEDKRAFPSLLEFGLKGGITLPGGLNPGQQVALLLDRIALPYYGLRSFDDLPTPYRCVATDLRKGDAVVIDRPPLARAMRATMAIPGVFTPVTWDDWLLVDGGALNNIPADVVRSMGADIVIAVDVGADSASDKQTETLFSMLGRTIGTMMTTNSRRALAAADIVIDPDLTGFNSGSWRNSDGLAERGFAAADRLGDRLRRFALTADAHAAFLEARQARRRRTIPQPTYVDVRGLVGPLSPRLADEIGAALTPALEEPLTPESMAARLLAVSGTDRYEYLTYALTDSPKPTGLQIGVRPKSYGPPFLMLGLDLNNIDSANFAFNVSSRVLHYGLLGAGSEARLDLVVGTRQRAALELLKPIGRSPVFVAARGAFDRRSRNLYEDGNLLAEYRVKRSGVGLDIGTDFGRRAELRLGYDVGAVRGRRRIGAPDLPEAEGHERFASLTVTFDSQTSPIVPTHGVRVQGVVRRYQAAARPSIPDPSLSQDQRFTTATVSGSWFRRVRERHRAFALGEAGSAFGGTPLIAPYTLGGALRLGAFNNDQLRGGNLALGVGGYLHEVGRLPDVLGGGVFAGGWVETGAAWHDRLDRNWATHLTLGLVGESLLGPIFAGGSVPLDGGGFRFYVALGPFFR